MYIWDTWECYIYHDTNTSLWVHFMQRAHQNLQTARFVTDVSPVTLAAGVSGGCCSTLHSDDLWLMNKWFLRILFELQRALQKIISSLTSCLTNTSQLSSCQPILRYDSCVCLVDIFPSANRIEYIHTHVCEQKIRSGSGICNIFTVVQILNTSWDDIDPRKIGKWYQYFEMS